MARDILKNMKKPEGEGNEKKEYTPPDEKLVDSELINSLLEHYITARDSKWANLSNHEAFDSNARTLESIIKGAKDKFHPQPLIDALTLMLVDYSDRQHFTITDYVTAVVQALYNLGYNDFTIDIRKWQKDRWAYYAGGYLKGREENPLTLSLYGGFWSCCYYAQHCNFTIHDKVEWSGGHAEHCTFDLMPNARIEEYIALESWGNRLRRMNEKGEWGEIG